MNIGTIPFGFQDIYTGVADEAVENPQVVDISGEATQTIKLIDPKTVELTVKGDVAVGPNVFQVTVDGHIGDGDVLLVTDFDYEVVSPDATTISFTKTRREPIPTTPT